MKRRQLKSQVVFNRETFYASVRSSLFSGNLSQSQVDGMDAILTTWEDEYINWDQRWLAYALATTYHETSKEMQPIEEYGKGDGMEYGKVDPETGQTYYGRGFVQLTWRDNYARVDDELDFDGDESCEMHAINALDLDVAAEVMFKGMEQGWFRANEKFAVYFNDGRDDPYGAREIINGDKTKVPSWSNGVSIGDLIKGYHKKFLTALDAAAEEAPGPQPDEEEVVATVNVTIQAPKGIRIVVTVDGEELE
jgi:putative chitinase